MDNVNVTENSALPTNLTELKDLFDKALEERMAVDVRIAQIRGAIEDCLKEAQALNDVCSELGIQAKKKNISKVLEDGFFTIDLKGWWNWFVAYILPPIIILAVLLFLMSFTRSGGIFRLHSSVDGAGDLTSVAAVVVDDTNQ